MYQGCNAGHDRSVSTTPPNHMVRRVWVQVPATGANACPECAGDSHRAADCDGSGRGIAHCFGRSGSTCRTAGIRESVANDRDSQQQVYFAIVTIFVAPFVEEIIVSWNLYSYRETIWIPKFALWSHFSVFLLSPISMRWRSFVVIYGGDFDVSCTKTTENLLARLLRTRSLTLRTLRFFCGRCRRAAIDR